MDTAIFGLATAVPEHWVGQQEAASRMIDAFALEGREADRLARIYERSSISKRHSVLEDFQRPVSEWQFWGPQFPNVVPGMAARNEVYKREAPRLAAQAAEKALRQWGGKKEHITHVISVSCTGVLAPGIEFLLIDSLGLSRGVERLGINFMGCFGAFKGLAVAKALACENPSYRILVVCTELCSLHLQSEGHVDQHVANALFADGAAAVVVGGCPVQGESPQWELVRRASMAVEHSLDLMTWEAGNSGYVMRLSAEVPRRIEEHIESFAHQLVKSDTSLSQCAWAVHPGGKAILHAVEKACGLTPVHTEASWKVLDRYGTMSSATFLFVLEELSHSKEDCPWCVGLGMGPGLSIEGLLLRNPRIAKR